MFKTWLLARRIYEFNSEITRQKVLDPNNYALTV